MHILVFIGGCVLGGVVVGLLVFIGTCYAIARGLNW